MMKFINENRTVAVLVILILFSGFIAGCVQGGNNEPVSPGNDTLTTAINKTGYEQTNETIALAIADGTYTDNVVYAYHSGNTTVGFTVTVENDVITTASAVPVNADPVSTSIIGNFNSALPELVVGKKISELSIPVNVAGSSLTTAAFKGYIEKIVAEN